MNIKKVLVVYDKTREKLKGSESQVIQLLRSSFDTVKIIPSIDSYDGEPYDLLIVFGGDGTILRCVRKLKGAQIPLLGINIGKFGFLACVELKQIEIAFKQLCQLDFNIQKRMLLEVGFISGNNHQIVEVLNETVLHRKNLARMLEVSFFINNKYVASFSGDGIIVATPTGSTAHSLSAGGPIVSPELESIIITPLTAHTLNVRPIVISPSDVVTLKLSDYKDVVLSFDGAEIVALDNETEISIRKSKSYAYFVLFKDWDFFRLLVDKFYWGIKKTS
jgi:NAD+ kinase